MQIKALNIQYNVYGKLNGKTVAQKQGMTYPDARELMINWERNGCSMIMNETYEQVTFTKVEIEPVEVLWSRSAEEEREMQTNQAEFVWKAERDLEKEAKGA